MTAAIPEGFATITPSLVVNGAADAIDFYTKAFGAKEVYRMPDEQSGKIMHACLEIGSSRIFLCDAMPDMGCNPTNANFYLYLSNVDATFNQAKQAGCEEKSMPEDMFWGDRVGCVTDRFGNTWTLATHVRDVSPQEMEEGRKNFAVKMGKAA
jgi:uncharacterized glyoxalase superfamily protein PhnB